MLKNLFKKRARPSPSLPTGQRVYAIGDIHGRLDLFNELLDLLERDTAERSACFVTLVLLGDLIDRGPNSAGVVQRAMDKPHWVNQQIVLMGNHEEAMIQALDGDFEKARMWLQVGGKSALESWGVNFSLHKKSTSENIITEARSRIPRAQVAWLGRMRASFQLGDYYFVHGGVRPGITLAKQIPEDQYWIREAFLESRMFHGAVVVHGHSIKAEVEWFDNRIGIDTGAYLTGRLTALCLEGTDRWLLQTGEPH